MWKIISKDSYQIRNDKVSLLLKEGLCCAIKSGTSNIGVDEEQTGNNFGKRVFGGRNLFLLSVNSKHHFSRNHRFL